MTEDELSLDLIKHWRECKVAGCDRCFEDVDGQRFHKSALVDSQGWLLRKLDEIASPITGKVSSMEPKARHLVIIVKATGLLLHLLTDEQNDFYLERIKVDYVKLVMHDIIKRFSDVPTFESIKELQIYCARRMIIIATEHYSKPY